MGIMAKGLGIAEHWHVDAQTASDLASESWDLIWQALGTDKSGLILPLMEIGGFIAGICVLVAGFVWITNINEKTVEEVIYPFFLRCLIVIILLKGPYNISDLVINMRDIINGTNSYVNTRIDQVTQYQKRMSELEQYNELRAAMINMRELCEAQKANKDNYYACMQEQTVKAAQMVEEFKKVLAQREKDTWDRLGPLEGALTGLYLWVFPQGADTRDAPMWEKCLARIKNDDPNSELVRKLENEPTNPPRNEVMPLWIEANKICGVRYSSQNSFAESAKGVARGLIYDPIKAGVDFVGSKIQETIREAVMFFTAGMHWAFQHAIEMTILISAFISPLAVATSLAPIGSGSPLMLWATGFWSLALVKLSLNIITAIAITVLYGSSADALIIGLLIGLLSPILAISLSAGGGVAMFNSIAMAGALLAGGSGGVAKGVVGAGAKGLRAARAAGGFALQAGKALLSRLRG